MKRICIIANGFTGTTIPLAEHLHREGYEVDCYYLLFKGVKTLDTIDFMEPMPACNGLIRESKNNIIYKYLSIDIGIFKYRVYMERKRYEMLKIGFLFKLLNKKRIHSFCKNYIIGKYDLANVIVYPDFMLNVCVFLSNHKIPFFITFHEVLEKLTGKGSGIASSFVNPALLLNTPVVVHSKKTYNDLLRVSEVQDVKGRSRVIHFGPFEGYVSYGEGIQLVRQTNYLLYFGVILPYKGLKYLYEAVQKLNDIKDLNVVIAGAGDDPILNEMTKDKRFLIINKYVQNDELVGLIKNCKAVVCPYINASQSGVAQTAMFFDKPIVASNVGAFSEIIQNGVNGYLVEPADSKDLESKIRLLFTNDIGRKLSIQISPEYCWDNIISKYSQLINELLE